MGDYLVDLGANRTARRVLTSLGLPLPLPQKLRRAEGPWVERPLADRPVIVGGAGELHGALSTALADAGACTFLLGCVSAQPLYTEAAEAFSRPLERLEEGVAPEGLRPHALIFDGTGLAGPDDLASLHAFFHPWIRKIARCGRVIVLGRPPGALTDPAAAAAAEALSGFARSVAREVGGRGATATWITVAEGAQGRLAAALRFVLSDRLAFVTGQPLHLDARAAAAPPRWTRPLDGKVALVTGAARGIGAACARRLSEEGARVICLDRPGDEEPLSLVAEAVGGQPFACDVTDPEAPARLAGLLAEGVDGVVHNAGVTRDRTLGKMDAARWDLAVQVNLGGVIRITEALIGGGLLREHGRVILLSSVAGIAGNFGQTNYAASKSGVIGYTRALAPTLADRGITVNAVAPGFVETRLTAAIPVATREAGRRLSSLTQGGVPQDIAEVITFLATPGASGLTGQVVRACGGSFLGA